MGKIYMHIGLSKTGSSAIQAFLALNIAKLNEVGFEFPESPDIENEQPFQTTSGNGSYFIRCIKEGRINELEDKLKSYISGKKDVIISSEVISFLFDEYFGTLVHLIEKYDMKLIMYIRKDERPRKKTRLECNKQT